MRVVSYATAMRPCLLLLAHSSYYMFCLPPRMPEFHTTAGTALSFQLCFCCSSPPPSHTCHAHRPHMLHAAAAMPCHAMSCHCQPMLLLLLLLFHMLFSHAMPCHAATQHAMFSTAYATIYYSFMLSLHVNVLFVKNAHRDRWSSLLPARAPLPGYSSHAFT